MNSSLTYLVNLISYRRDSIVVVFDLGPGPLVHWSTGLRKPHGWLISRLRRWTERQGPQSGMQNSCKDAPRSWLGQGLARGDDSKQRQPTEQDLDLYVDLKTDYGDNTVGKQGQRMAAGIGIGIQREQRLGTTRRRRRYTEPIKDLKT